MTARAAIRRGGLYSGYALAALLCLAILVAAGLTARLAVGPMPINFLGPSLRESLNEHLYYAYDVKFDDLRLTWSDGYGNLGLSLSGVRVADYSLQDIASVPRIIVGLDPGAIVTGGRPIKAIAVQEPRVRWIETAGGAVKFDVGADNPGDSGKILEDFLITMAAAPDPSEETDRALPEIRIIDSAIRIENELNGSALQISDADILVEPDATGVRSAFALTLETDAGPIRIDATGLYRTADQQIELDTTFTDLDLHTLWSAEQAPLLQIIPAEPLTGAIRFDMDKFFTVDAAEFGFEGQTATIDGRAKSDANTVTIEARYTFPRNASADAWPPALAPSLQQWLAVNADGPSPVSVDLEGTIGRFDDTLDLRGTIAAPETPITVSGLADDPIVVLAD